MSELTSRARIWRRKESSKFEEGQASFLLKDFTLAAFIEIAPQQLVRPLGLLLKFGKESDRSSEVSKGGSLRVSLKLGKRKTSFDLFNSLIGLIPSSFHNFVGEKSDFSTLESITWQRCKNLLLILLIVANMLAVSQRAPAL